MARWPQSVGGWERRESADSRLPRSVTAPGRVPHLLDGFRPRRGSTLELDPISAFVSPPQGSASRTSALVTMLGLLCAASAAASALMACPVHSGCTTELTMRSRVVANAALSAPAVTLAYGGGDGGSGGHGRGGGGGGGGGGDDDETAEFLRLLNSAEQATVLDDWVGRSRIYKLTDNSELSRTHSAHLAELEAMTEFDTSGSGPRGRRMVLGLFQDESVRAIAGAEVSHASGLVVSSLLLYPSELNNEDSTTSLRMIHALHLLADAIESPLDMSPLRESEGTASWLGQLVSEEADE